MKMGMTNNIKSILLLYPTYFSPIVQYVALVQTDTIIFEVHDNYQKQTYRTRCYIYSPNGKQLLNIPVRNANSKQKTRDVIIDYSFNWQVINGKFSKFWLKPHIVFLGC